MAVENREPETNEWTVTEFELQALTMTRKRETFCDRNVLNSANVEESTCIEERKTPDEDCETCGGGKGTQAHRCKTLQLDIDCEGPRTEKGVDRLLPRTPLHPKPSCFHSERKDTLDRVMEELESGLRSGFVGFDEEAAQGAGQAEEREGLPRWHHCRCTERAARGLCGKTGMSTVEDVLGHEVPARVVVPVNGHGPEGRGCIEPCEVQDDLRGCVRCERYWAMSGSKRCPVHCARQSRQRLFVPKTHADAGMFLLVKAAELSREWQQEMVMVQLDVKKAFDQWTIERRSKRRDSRV